MMSVNVVVLAGKVGRDPEKRITKNETPVANFPLAVDTYAGGRLGEVGIAHALCKTQHNLFNRT